MKMPNKKTKKDISIEGNIWMLYGPGGIGKSTVANSFGNTLFIYNDPGVKWINAYKMKCMEWSRFLRILDKLKDDHSKYDAIVIDTIDLVYDSCVQSILEKYGIGHPSELDWSRGWTMIKQEFEQAMASLCTLDKTVILISHSKTFMAFLSQPILSSFSKKNAFSTSFPICFSFPPITLYIFFTTGTPSFVSLYFEPITLNLYVPSGKVIPPPGTGAFFQAFLYFFFSLSDTAISLSL